jgi:hypothetical protein
VKDEYEGWRFTKKDHSTGNFILEGSLGFAQRGEFEFCSRKGSVQGGTGLLEVLGTGVRISIWYPGARKLS